MLSARAFTGTPSLSPTPSVATAPKKIKKHTEPTNLSDDELRRRIFANAAVLFPSSITQGNAYEVVYGTRPRLPRESSTGDENPWQYAMLVRRSPSGEYTPLMRGQVSSTSVPWSMALQGLLDSTATAIHKKLGSREMPPLGISEELPRYSSSLTRNTTQ